MMVLVGVRFCDEKYVVGLFCEPCWPKELNTLVGLEAACELSCEKLRKEDAVRAVASGYALEVANGRAFRSRLEPVEAISRVRDAIASV
jgi:hypothetical protein